MEVRGTDRRMRKANVEIKYMQAVLKPPIRSPEAKSETINSYAPLSIFVVSVEEVGKDNGEEKISWQLLTNIAVDSLESALERVQWYQLRWSIEDYHKILKFGCKVEDCRLATKERLEKFITVKSVIAFKIMELTFLPRSQPDIPCTKVLTTLQWQVLYLRIHRTKKYPTQPPSLKQASEWIARLGGYKARPQDPPPGYIVVWRGFERLAEMVSILAISEGLESKRCGD